MTAVTVFEIEEAVSKEPSQLSRTVTERMGYDEERTNITGIIHAATPFSLG